LCDRGVDESIDALVLAVAEEATKNKATTTVFVFVLVVLRLPDRLILSFSCNSAKKLPHSSVVSFCTQVLIDHCITSWFLFCLFCCVFFCVFDYCLLQSEVAGNTSAKIHHREPSALFFFFCCCRLLSRVQVMRTGCNFEHTFSC
jgi:hypothetical protein